MQWLSVCVLATAIYSGGGVTKKTNDHFWGDIKVFDQFYGRVFDKELYGDKLPASVSFNGDKNTQASEKKERYAIPSDTNDFDPYGFGDKNNFLKKEKPAAASTFNFLSYGGFKPISQSSDPETYNYLKRLEEEERERKFGKIKGVSGYKPYVNDVENVEETYAYKVIQNILDAHEANKGNGEKDEDNSKYLIDAKKNSKNFNNKKPPRKAINNAPKSRCPGRCRKRPTISKIHSRPYYRRIKHRIY